MTKFEQKLLNDFLDGYLESAAWSSIHTYMNDDGTEGETEEGLEGFDFGEEAESQLKEEATRWYNKHLALFAFVGDFSQVGHDFWLTRNGHGAGFWDRGKLYVDPETETDNKQALADSCGWQTEFNELNLYLNDNDEIEVDGIKKVEI